MDNIGQSLFSEWGSCGAPFNKIGKNVIHTCLINTANDFEYYFTFWPVSHSKTLINYSTSLLLEYICGDINMIAYLKTPILQLGLPLSFNDSMYSEGISAR